MTRLNVQDGYFIHPSTYEPLTSICLGITTRMTNYYVGRSMQIFLTMKCLLLHSSQHVVLIALGILNKGGTGAGQLVSFLQLLN